MVSSGTLLVGAALIIGFFAVGGVQGVKGISSGIGERAKGAFAIPEAAAEESTQVQPEAIPIIQTNVAGQRKVGSQLTTVVRISEIKPELQQEVARSVAAGGTQIIRGGTILVDKPTLKDVRTLTGRGTAQFSTGQTGRLSKSKRAEIAARELTPQEIKDVAALEARRQRAIGRGIRPNIKLRGAELVLRKREQEELSKSLLTSRFGGQTFVGGKLFAKPLFATGGKA